MLVKVKKLNEKAKLPYKKYAEDFCYDLVATSEEEVAPNVWKYGVGLAFQIERDNNICDVLIGYSDNYDGIGRAHLRNDVNLSIDVRPRSSIWQRGMILSNCEGTIDELYRGEVCAVFYHVMPNMPRYKVGDRICQIKLGMALPLDFVITDVLSDTERGDKGFGSTGK